MSAHVLLNLMNELGEKRSNVRLVKHFIYFFCNKFIEFNKTGA